jgi:hypothetical protein
MPKRPPSDYPVGYGRPPEHSRFRKGRSGNPKGRPRGSKNVTALLEDALDEVVVVTERGRRRPITKRQAMLMQIVNKAASGDIRSQKLVLDYLQKDASAKPSENSAEATAALSENERDVFEELRRHFQQPTGSNDEATEPE